MTSLTSQKFYSNGKLLITGEYLVLDGALSLALPTKFGQSLTIQPSENETLEWESLNHLGNIWFESKISLDDGFRISKENDISVKERLKDILNAIKRQNPNFLKASTGFKIRTELDFPRDWGLGTSSTLINNLAQWAQVDPYVLLEATFGGSGYDIACAKHNRPITYQLDSGNRTIIERPFNPDFKAHLYFVHLNQKQDSRAGIASYRKRKTSSSLAFSEINAITNDMLSCTSLETFQFLMQSHESIISEITGQQTVQSAIFNDFNGSIKSLGAWGGDFIMVASEESPANYFEGKGYETLLGYQEMIL